MRPFVSYARKDAAWARRICAALREKGIRPWFDEDDLVAGSDWRAEIRKAVARSSHFIMLLSKHSVSKTGFVQSEIHLALTLLDERPANRIFVIPVRLDDCHPDDERIEKLHRIDLFRDYESGIAQLVRSLRAAARRRTTPTRKSAAPSPKAAVETTPKTTRRTSPRPEKDRSRAMVHYYRGPGEAGERITMEDRDAQIAARINARRLREFVLTDVVRSLENEIARPRRAPEPADDAIRIAARALAWTDLNTVGALEDELHTNGAAIVACAKEALSAPDLRISGCASLVALACIEFVRHGEDSCLELTLENAGFRDRDARAEAQRTIRKIASGGIGPSDPT